ncbi:MAG: hypothetical protein DRI69_03295 [Bacteroidetes bacterium]|nr:MAG: hypothetical protein DRI69_03295 [Bacteroidota bacterium]
MQERIATRTTGGLSVATLLFALLMTGLSINMPAQSVGINNDGSAPNSKAILDIKSTTMGLLIPRMKTSQRTVFGSTLTTMEAGMLIYDTDEKCCYFWDGAEFKEVKTGVFTVLEDLDGDTKVQVEENPDEDVIRFDVGGTERWVMDSTRLEPRNSGASVFIGEGAGNSDDLTDNRNIAIGTATLYNNRTGDENTAVGYKALSSDTTGSNNVALGSFALYHNTDRSSLVAIGDSALFNNGLDVMFHSEARSNTAVGSKSLLANTTGYANTAVGERSLKKNTSGRLNTAVGTNALNDNYSGHRNTAIGNGSLAFHVSGDFNTALGNAALFFNHSGDKNTAVGTYASFKSQTGTDNTAIGYNSLYSDTIGTANVAIGSHALYSNRYISNLVAIGDSALFYNAKEDNTHPYYSAGNTAVGAGAMLNNTTGYYNTALGFQALYSNTNGTLNTALGWNALHSNNGRNNTALGYRALASAIDVTGNTAVGTAALLLHKTGDRNTAVGTSSLYASKSATDNTAVGYRTLFRDTAGTANVAIGSHALFSNRSRSNLVAIGDSALYNNASSDGALFYQGAANTAVGSGAMLNNTIGYYNTALGFHALYDNTSGQHNTAIGREALYSNNGGQNTALGYRALYSKDAGISNTVLGAFAEYNLTSGQYNTIIGAYADYFNINGEKNTIIGYEAGKNTGAHGKDGNVFIGYKAGYYETGDNKLYIENTIASSPLIYGDFSTDQVGINGLLGIGTENPSVELDIEGITPTIALNNLKIADLGNSNLGLDGDLVPYGNTTFDLGNNAASEHWDQVWAISFNIYSDLNTKENVRDIQYGLDQILDLHPVSFEYKDEIEPMGKEHFGLIAQEVQPIMPSIVITNDVDVDPVTGEFISTPGQYLGMSYMELIPVLIKSVQELSAQIINQQNKIEILKNENDLIKVQVSEMMKEKKSSTLQNK